MNDLLFLKMVLYSLGFFALVFSVGGLIKASSDAFSGALTAFVLAMIGLVLIINS